MKAFLYELHLKIPFFNWFCYISLKFNFVLGFYYMHYFYLHSCWNNINKEYWKEILWPPVPVWMKCPLPLMPVIELFGIISKPFALTIRLFANTLAGHMVILALTSLVFVSVSMGTTMNIVMTIFSVILTVFMLVLEILVAYIQAYVFTMLSSVFVGLSRPEHHAAIKDKTKHK